MRHVPRILLAGAVLLLAAAPRTHADQARRPALILDQKDLSIERYDTACNTYVITCKKTKEVVVVDPGRGVEALVADFERTGHRLRGIWITHEHGDHLTGLAPLADKTTAPFVAHAVTQKVIARRGERTRSSEAGSSARTDAAKRVTALVGGERLTLGTLTWKVLHLPGHSPGSVGFLLPGRVLVAGDVLFKGSIGRTDLASSDAEVFRRSLGTLWRLPDEVVVLPGHGAHTTIGAEKRSSRLFQDFTRAARPWMGIELAPGHGGTGLAIGAVREGSPAMRAGLRVGDVLLEAQARALSTPGDLAAVIARHGAGDPLTLVLLRGGETKTLTLSLGTRPPR